MPHLASDALWTDRDGLAFLRDVLRKDPKPAAPAQPNLTVIVTEARKRPRPAAKGLARTGT